VVSLGSIVNLGVLSVGCRNALLFLVDSIISSVFVVFLSGSSLPDEGDDLGLNPLVKQDLDKAVALGVQQH
jgi:hypothetical protein